MFHLGVDVNMTATLAAKQAGVSVSDVILFACGRALCEHPAINAHYDSESITQFADVNLGLAVATDRGLVVPVLQRAHVMTVTELARVRKDLVGRAHAGDLSMADVTGGTFTVSNLGMLGIDVFDAIVNSPQVAILAVGTTRSQPAQGDGEIVWRPISRMTLTCDHRALDGATAAGFLVRLRELLECYEPS